MPYIPVQVSRSEQISTLAGKKSSLTMPQARGLSWSEHYSFPLLSKLLDYGMPLQIANVSVHRWRYCRPFLRWVIFCSTKDGFITSLKIANVCCVNLSCTTGCLHLNHRYQMVKLMFLFVIFSDFDFDLCILSVSCLTALNSNVHTEV